ncbi:MAG TPA: PqqD family protein [Vicinamibacteria bacterium]
MNVEAAAYRRNAQVEEAPLSGELMLFDPARAQFFVLNRTMAYIWRRCDGAHGRERLLAGLQQEFAGVEEEAASADLQRALDELLALGLVTATETPGETTAPR